jgi:pantoate kinase
MGSTALVTTPVAAAKAFSPGHITGFFEMPAGNHRHFLHKGSKGAGFSIDRGVATTVYVYESAKTGYQISINGSNACEAEVSRWVAEEYLKIANRPYFVIIEHDIGIPVGFGLGSSGAAALSLSYALNEALHAGLSRTQAAQVAHHAEISCKTGLGTVIAEFSGGFEMRTNAGAPGIGTVIKTDLRGYKAVVLCLAPISTKSFLTNRMDEINGLGGAMLKKLSATRSSEDFLRMSREFAETLGLTEGRCKAPIAALKATGFDSSVALFGQTVFTLMPADRAKEARDALKGFGGTLLICNIDGQGARVL